MLMYALIGLNINAETTEKIVSSIMAKFFKIRKEADHTAKTR
jgi:hypothetical protein